MSTVDTTLGLSTQTLDWLANHPHARQFVRSVWDKLTDLERSGQHPEAVAALRRVLTHHQPTSAGRCSTCARVTCRRRPFPCIVWHQIRGELCEQFATAAASRFPSPPDHRNPPPMLNREQPAPFLIIGDSPGGALAVPTASARAAAQAARHLTEYCPHTTATWQVNPHATLGPVVVFGCARPPTGKHLHPQLRRPLVAGRSPGGGSST